MKDPIFERSEAVHRGVLLEQYDVRPRNDRPLPLVGIDHSGNALEQRRLARAVAADEGEAVALANVQVEITEEPTLALDQPKVFVGEGWRRHFAALATATSR